MASSAAILRVLVTANTTQANAALAGTQAQLSKTATTAQTSTRKTSAATSAMATKLKAWGKTGALAAAAVAAASVKMALDFDEAMMKVRNLTGQSQKDVEKWADAILKLAPKVGKSPQDLAEALYFVASAGIKTKDVMATVSTAAKASAVGLGDTETVADALTSAMNAYAKSGYTAKDATEVLMKTVKYGKLEADELSQSIGRVIPVAAKLKVPFEDVGASLGIMSLSGLDAAESTTALRGIFTALIKPTDQGKKALDKVGLSYGQLQRMAVGPGGILEVLRTLSDHFEGNSNAMAKMFPNIRGLVGVFNILGNRQSKVNEIFKGTEEHTNELGAAMERLRQTPAFKLHQAMAFIQAMLIRLGNALLDVAFVKIPKLVEALKDFWKQSGPFRAAMNLIWEITKRTWAGIKQLFENGFRVIKGIVKVISGVLTGNWSRAWDGVKDIFKGGIGAALGALRAMTAPVREIAERIGKVLAKVFTRIADYIRDKVVGIFSAMKNAISDAISWIENAVNDVLVALGIKEKIEISAPAGPRGPTQYPPSGPQGPKGHQRGGKIDGMGTGDTVPTWLEPGEYVVNRRGTARYRGLLDEINFKAAPRFQRGGMSSAASGLARSFVSRFGGSISSGYRPGDTGSFHSTGQAFDWVGGDWNAATRYANMIGPSLLEGIHQGPPGQNVSWDSGRQVSPSFWGSATWAQHISHIHIAVGKAIKAIATQIGRLGVTGHGPLSKATQALVDRMRNAANRYIAKSMPSSVLTADVPAKGSYSMGSLESLWRATGRNGDPHLMAAIAMAESGGNPNADNGIARGLWQIIASTWAAYGKGSWNNAFNPQMNAVAAHNILAGSGLQAWDAYTNGAYQQFMQRGGYIPSYAGGGIVPGPLGWPQAAIVHGGERIIPPGDSRPPVVNVNVNHSYADGMGWLADYIDSEVEVQVEDARRQDAVLGRMG